MSDHTIYVHQPGVDSTEGAYMRNPQEPSYYFQDANQLGAPQSAQTVSQAAVTANAQQAPSVLGSWFNVTDTTYLKGLLLGAGVALVATNPTVQKAVVSGAVKLWAVVQGGVEEIKEQIQDVKAELSQQE